MRKINIEELGHIAAPLSFVELHYEQESTPRVPWAREPFSIAPYIFYKREGDQVYFYYDPQGIAWQMRQAGAYADSARAIIEIKTHFDAIAPALRHEQSLTREELRDFLGRIRALWPWLNYMWWGIEYKEKNNKSFEELLAVRKYTEYFTPGLVAVLRNSATRIFPGSEVYANVVLLSEMERGILPDDATLQTRLQDWAYTSSQLYGSWDELVHDYRVEIIEPVLETVLKGQVAYGGRGEGRVRVVGTREDLHSFEMGDILVASTTTPDFLPAMKKAAAIISEHGGVICHAAITSRELKIPCVVGVKGATKFLKNGDWVEVDAEKGTVQIVERA